MDTPSIPAPRFKYSLSWAACVVDEVASKYPRATEIICRVYGITRWDLVKYLAKPDVMWNYLRERIKYLALCEERTGKQMDYSTVVEWCRSLHNTKHAHGQAERLDKRAKELKLEEQGSRGGGGRSVAEAESSLPSSSLLSSSPNPLQFVLNFDGGA